MFRCTDCGKEYETRPDYCECGNDNFDEVGSFAAEPQYSEEYDEYGNPIQYDDGGFEQEEYVPVPKLKYNKKPKKSSTRTKKPLTTGDMIGIGVFAVCIVLSLLVFIFMGSGKTGNRGGGGNIVLHKDYSIPASIDAIWDSTAAFEPPTAAKVDPSKILNTKLQSLDSEMNSYLISLAEAMIAGWDRSGITGDGVTQMEFRIDKDGKIVGKKIFKFSGNKSLDNSVGMLINSFGKFQTPPSTYNNEVVIISFSSKNGAQKAYFPNVKTK